MGSVVIEMTVQAVPFSSSESFQHHDGGAPLSSLSDQQGSHGPVARSTWFIRRYLRRAASSGLCGVGGRQRQID